MMLIATNSKLTIDEDILSLVPRPTKSERRTLKFSIAEDGQQMPIICNSKFIILDGHTRAEICEELHIKPKFSIKKFENSYDERKFIIISNLARRQLSKFQKIELAWEIYEVEKQKANQRMYGHGGWGFDTPNPKDPEKLGSAAQIFAKYMDVGRNTVVSIAYLKKHADQSLLIKLRNGEISIFAAYDLCRGLAIIPNPKRKPKQPPKCCKLCSGEIKVKRKLCHVHKWYCCTRCKWGI